MNPQLSILLICKSLPWRFNGGIQTHTWDLARALVAKGHRVTILTGGALMKGSQKFEKEGVDIVELAFFPGRYLPLVSYLAEEFAFNQQVKSWVKANHHQFQIIHAQGRSGYLLYAISTLKSKLVQTIHGLTGIESQANGKETLNLKLHSFFAQKWEKQLLTACRSTIVVSQDLKRAILSEGLEEKVQVIPNGISQQVKRKILGRDEQVDRFVFVGRLSPVKGLIPLLKAIARSEKKVYLDIIGDGPQKEEISRLIQDLELQNQVRLLGAYANSTIHFLLPHYRALVLPSSYESQGIVLLEANYHGLPVVASDLPSIRESVNHLSNGLLCDQTRPESFVEAMYALSQNPDWAKEMGANGRSLVEQNFSWDKIAQDTLAVYQKVAS